MSVEVEAAVSDAKELESARTPYHLQALEGLLPVLLGAEILAWLVILPIALHGRADFRQLYVAGYMVRTGHAHELYNYESQLQLQSQLVGAAQVPLAFIRPAYSALLFAPLSLLSYRLAYLTFMGLNLVLLVICYWLMQPWLQNLARIWSWLPPLLFLAFYPVSAALLQGQDSILLLAVLLCSLAFLERGRDRIAGAVLALGLFKFQVAIPLALLFLLWRRWRFVAGFAASASVLAGVSIAVVGTAASERYIRLLTSISDRSSHTATDVAYPVLTQFMPNLHGLVFGLCHSHLPALWIKALAVALSLTTLFAVAILGRTSGLPIEKWSVAVVGAALASYYLFLHDLTVLLIPIAVCLNEYESQKSKLFDALLGWCSAVAFIAPVCDLFLMRFRFLLSLPLIALLVLMWVRLRAAPGPIIKNTNAAAFNLARNSG